MLVYIATKKVTEIVYSKMLSFQVKFWTEYKLDIWSKPLQMTLTLVPADVYQWYAGIPCYQIGKWKSLQ